MNYYDKTRFLKIFLPIVIIIPSVLIGYNIARGSFAATPPATGISISTDKTQYMIGDNVAVTLSNTTLKDVYVKNNCPYEPLAVYRLENNNWASLSESADASKCAGEPSVYDIPADRSIKTDYHYWPDLFDTPGTYKIVANIENYSDGPSVQFQVVNRAL